MIQRTLSLQGYKVQWRKKKPAHVNLKLPLAPYIIQEHYLIYKDTENTYYTVIHRTLLTIQGYKDQN